MTRRIGNVVILEAERPRQCDDCGKVAELRPYGPNRSSVCHDCAMKDNEGTKRRMAKLLFDEDI